MSKSFGLRVSPQQVSTALNILKDYVEERANLVRDGGITKTVDAIKMMEAMDTFKDAVGGMVKSPAELLYNALRFTTIPQLMDGEDITQIGVDGVGKVNLMDDIQVAVTDKEGLKTWLTANDCEDIITETVNAQTLAALLRRRIKDNKSLPNKTIAIITPVVRAQLTRSK